MITKITDFTLDNTKPTPYTKLDTFLGETTVKMGPLEANSFLLE